MSYYVGIDGGGSTLRVVIATDADGELETVVSIETERTSNPAVVGQRAAADYIRQGVQEALTAAGLSAGDIAAAALGVAGADVLHAREWLEGVLPDVLPDALRVPSSDQEIALVGANGERRGVLLLAGTGSVAYGVNAAGASVRAGGWGYLLGDEGSGYWLAMGALRAVTHAADGRARETALTEAILAHTEIENVGALIEWLYHTMRGRNREIAQLAPLVLKVAADGDAVAAALVDEGATQLYGHYTAITRRLGMSAPPVAFAGGLLTADTLLRARLMDKLGMTHPPETLYPPVVGAALLAKIRYQENTQTEQD